MQFARVAHATSFLYCYSILESNKRSEYGSSSHNPEDLTHQSHGVHLTILDAPANVELNTFFPFDPYRLPKSNAYIEGIYREWSAVAIDDGEDDDDDEEEDDGEDSITAPQSLSGSGYLPIPRPLTTHSDDDKGLGASLGAMSISPSSPASQ